MANPETVICTYRVMPSKEDDFLVLLRAHFPKLRELGLVVGEPSKVYRGRDSEQKPFFIEIFTWRDADAVEAAHASPDLLLLWDPMAKLCESRGGRPAMEFPHVEPVDLA